MAGSDRTGYLPQQHTNYNGITSGLPAKDRGTALSVPGQEIGSEMGQEFIYNNGPTPEGDQAQLEEGVLRRPSTC